MTTTLTTPTVAELTGLARTIASWQRDGGPLQLHPGDLGWHSMRGAARTAECLRAWSYDGELAAVGLLDGPDNLLRMAVAPGVRDDLEVARGISADLEDPERGVLVAGEAIVEARGATALADRLSAAGWQPDEPWIPMHRDLTEPVEAPDAHVSIEAIGPDRVDPWVSVHWSAFKGTPFDDEQRQEVRQWWLTMAEGPFYDDARSLAAFDADGHAVAVTTVWSAGRGRPGLVEPMGVHRDHRGRGYGIAISVAAAEALRAMGSSSAIVCAEESNQGAVATYLAAGFTAHDPVADLVRPA